MSETKFPPDGTEIGPRSPRKELTIHLFHLFLVSISESKNFLWPRFTRILEYEALKESLRLTGGNGREAASLLGVKYNTFMKRAHKHGLTGRSRVPRPSVDPSSMDSTQGD